MGTLTGQQINQSYQGLLKLADSSAGISSNLQSIQDGLGNDTGLRIATNMLETINIPSFVPLKAQYYGPGFINSAGVQMPLGTQNIILCYPFYDNGNFSYSAMTYNVVTATTSSDTCQAAIYTTQMINPYGIFPYAPIISGITITTNSTGLKTATFASNISFSGYGAGIYWMVFKVSNSGVQPTVRFGTSNPYTSMTLNPAIYGAHQAVAANTYNSNNGYRTQGNYAVLTGTTTFDNPYSTSLPLTQSSTVSIGGSNLGFILHTVDY